MTGQTISHYQILEKLGAGGMGVVYKAKDTKLNRAVALKFLPPDLTRDQEAIDRFINEAQTASALDHANICTIHEINETQDGQMYIVMAYYAGETLQQKVSSGQLSMDSAIDIAMQTAQGLLRAHEAGITHRDIKPSNLVITPRGEVKIIDFGLAKLAGLSRLTKSGSTPGTVAYMSPEQVQGKPVDQRTDIWSLGVVLFEMLTGRLPFRGENEAATIFSIVNEPLEPLARHRTGVSEGLQRIVDKALFKDVEIRYQHIDELLADLKGKKRGVSELIKPIAKVKNKKPKQTRIIYAATAIVSAVIIISSLYLFNKQPAKQILPTHRQITFNGDASYPAISPDGQFVAYLIKKEEEKCLIVQDLLGGQSLEAFSGFRHLWSLKWSPDGSKLALRAEMSDSSIASFIVPRLGGSHHRLTTANFLCWSADGSQIASSNASTERIWFTNPFSGDTSSIPLHGSFAALLDIDCSPLYNRLLFLTKTEGQFAIWTIKADGSEQQKVVEDNLLFSPRWSNNGKAILYLRQNGPARDLMKVKIARGTGKAEAPAYVLQNGLQAGDFISLSKHNNRLSYIRRLGYKNLWLVNVSEKNKAQTVQTQKLTSGTSFIQRPKISPDGKKIAFSIGHKPEANIFVMPLKGGSMQQLTFLDGYNSGAVWSPDGKEIAFGSIQGGRSKVCIVNVNGGPAHRFAKSEVGETFELAWSLGARILYPRPEARNFHILNLKTEEERPLVANDSLGRMYTPRCSPDGKRVAVRWNLSTQPHNKMRGLWLISLQDFSQVFLYGGLVEPIEWSADGKWIYAWHLLKKQKEILMIPVSGGESKTLVTLPFENIFEDDISITPDGKHIICNVTESLSDVWLMENFDPEVKEQKAQKE